MVFNDDSVVWPEGEDQPLVHLTQRSLRSFAEVFIMLRFYRPRTAAN